MSGLTSCTYVRWGSCLCIRVREIKVAMVLLSIWRIILSAMALWPFGAESVI